MHLRSKSAAKAGVNVKTLPALRFTGTLVAAMCLSQAALGAPMTVQAQQAQVQGSQAPLIQEKDPIPSPDDITPGVPAPPPNAAPANNSANAAANGSNRAPNGVPPSTPASSTSTTAANVPTNGEVAQPAGSNTVNVGRPQEPTRSGNDQYVFRAEVNEVRLYATVMDQHQRLVSDLNKQDFQVYEDGQPQEITMVRQEDVPIALGILIDNSGSMREKREAVNDAALNLVKASNPHDQVFVVNFNDEAYADQDFTSDVGQLKDGLEHIDARGGTAMYDAVIASSKHIIENASMLKKKGIVKRVLLLVTDGEDTASRESLEDAIRYVQTENGPTIYTIGILDNDSHAKRAKRALEALAVQTGGVAFFPRSLDEVDAISKEVAHDIRNQYVIQYKSTTPKSVAGYRQVKVDAFAPGRGKLQVRTKAGYYAGSNEQAAVENSEQQAKR